MAEVDQAPPALLGLEAVVRPLDVDRDAVEAVAQYLEGRKRHQAVEVLVALLPHREVPGHDGDARGVPGQQVLGQEPRVGRREPGALRSPRSLEEERLYALCRHPGDFGRPDGGCTGGQPRVGIEQVDPCTEALVRSQCSLVRPRPVAGGVDDESWGHGVDRFGGDVRDDVAIGVRRQEGRQGERQQDHQQHRDPGDRPTFHA